MASCVVSYLFPSVYITIVILQLLTTHGTGFKDMNNRKNRIQTFLYKMLEDYDNRIPPNFDEKAAANVSLNLFISSFDSISENTMDYLITIFLRQRWSDPRLNYEDISDEDVLTLDSNMVSEIWLPDLFFTNEKKSHFHDVTVPNKFLRIYRNGTIYYSSRVSLTLSCPMKLHKFPMDTQVCNLQMESFAYTTNRLRFIWDSYSPVEICSGLELPQFSLDNYHLTDCTKTYSTGSFPCLQVNFILRRDIGYYMIQTYVPSALVVILSWVSFWINIDAVPARITLGVLTILTTTTQSTGVRQSLPRVSYIKAIDVWMSTCLVFVFASLLEFAIVNVLSRKEVKRMVTIRRTKQMKTKQDNDDLDEGEVLQGGKLKKAAYLRDPFGKDKARTVDKYARKLFPLGFILFNIIYWTSDLYELMNNRVYEKTLKNPRKRLGVKLVRVSEEDKLRDLIGSSAFV
ncbi:hypothetical protein LSH36_129g06003 [Paralvinella palmiformis]|uniref:Uncharacterized protein n=1 Tax=Paralvinella palmiformis TaxID=53620 RepID=A0AAD9JWM2_9ANNE|nr:hypothetical protein LSH36_129g06003 [Paralvinella palmiformis]